MYHIPFQFFVDWPATSQSRVKIAIEGKSDFIYDLYQLYTYFDDTQDCIYGYLKYKLNLENKIS